MKHLKPDQIIQLVAMDEHDSSNQVLRQHLAECPACRAQVDDLHSTVKGFGQAMKETADSHHVQFSGGQIRTLAAQRSRSHSTSNSWLRWMSVPVLGALILAAVTFLPQRQSVLTNAADAADEALLLKVNSAVSRDAITALAPATLINVERNQKLSATTQKVNR
jgi:hypothetical protein